MAVLIASSLRKEFSGDPLFDGVSFKVERRDRVALAGPNGAGKTTLLRALVGETNLQGGELAFQKGTRVALHDQVRRREGDGGEPAVVHAPRVRACDPGPRPCIAPAEDLGVRIASDRGSGRAPA